MHISFESFTTKTVVSLSLSYEESLPSLSLSLGDLVLLASKNDQYLHKDYDFDQIQRYSDQIQIAFFFEDTILIRIEFNRWGIMKKKKNFQQSLFFLFLDDFYLDCVTFSLKENDKRDIWKIYSNLFHSSIIA